MKEQSLEATRVLAEDRLHSCNILADSLRNVITKSGLIFSLIKLELGFFKGPSGKKILMAGSDQADIRRNAIQTLNNLLGNTDEISEGNMATDLMHLQNRFLELHPSPEQGKNWLRMKIEDKWNTFIREGKIDEKQVKVVEGEIEMLKKIPLPGWRPRAAGYLRPVTRIFKSGMG